MKSNSVSPHSDEESGSGSTSTGKNLPVRILFLESGTGPGGSVNFLRDVIPLLDPLKVTPTVGLYSPNCSTSMDAIRNLGVPVIVFGTAPHRSRKPGPSASKTQLKAFRILRATSRIGFRLIASDLPQALKIARFIRRNGIQVIVLNQDVHFHLSGVLAAKLTGVSCVCRKAGGINEAKRIKRIITPWVDLFISISKATDDDQRNTPGTRKLLKIHEGLDLQRFDSLPSKQSDVMRQELGVPQGKKVVATISRVEMGKGQVEFLRMAVEVLRSDPNVIFLVVGDQGAEGGGLMATLKETARALKLDEVVIFTGWREDVPQVLAAVDIFVHCPTTFIEGLARTCLEAMAMRVPAVVSDNGGMPDAVMEGVTGYVVPPGDVRAMATAVLRLLADDELCRKQGLNARLRVERVFNISRNTQQFQDVLLECAGSAAQARPTEYPTRALA